jgi:hypothetical protein
MMRAEFDQANVAGDAAVISCPGFEHALRIIFVIDFGEDPAVSVVDEKNDHLQALPPTRDISVMPLPTRSEFDRMGHRAGMSPERGEERTERSRVAGEFVLGNQPDARFRRARCCSLAADEAEAVLVDAAGAVAGGEEVQFVDHMVVAAYEGLIDPCPL